MKIYNAFGIKPTNTYVSAGSDYYIPNIHTDEQKRKAFEAFRKSYNKTDDELNELLIEFDKQLSDKTQLFNCLHLFLALGNKFLDGFKEDNIYEAINYFMTHYYRYDNKRKVVGIALQLNDTLFINSGIKIALDTVISDRFEEVGLSTLSAIRSLGIGVAGLYVNKSGMGNKGYDIRACLVDEDYSGYVHLSVAFTKDLFNEGKNVIYAGDKLTQMMLIPVFHTEYEEISENEYNDIMKASNRGDSGFGSSDVKH